MYKLFWFNQVIHFTDKGGYKVLLKNKTLATNG